MPKALTGPLPALARRRRRGRWRNGGSHCRCPTRRVRRLPCGCYGEFCYCRCAEH